LPTYDYECSKCGYKFEEFQSMAAKPLKTCPKCKKDGLHRLIGGGSGIIFKGSGFYQTDYKNKGKAGGKKGDSCPAKKDGTCGGCGS